ncbi:family 16 glycosylhydrolase [Roseomonas sp. BN140053]|uniref:glycoside hydrolase family 16 protein n=1 Tax=Roseomonas sp. BN140053 TaxID=3391898 RepID=UPI0039E920EC
MPDVRISELPAATTLAGAEFAGIQGGVTKRFPAVLLANGTDQAARDAAATALNMPLALASTPGVTLAFDYVPSRDGLALLTGGPAAAGYAADAAANPSRIWQPRMDTTDGTPNLAKGTDMSGSGMACWLADPEYPWSNGHSPFAIVDGNLRIRAQRTAMLGFRADEIPNDPITGQPYAYVSGVLNTKYRFATRHAYIEVVARYTSGKGSWPAIWTFPTNDRHPPELDLMEHVGGVQPVTSYQANFHTGNPNARAQHPVPVNAGADLTQGFHKFAVDFSDSAVKFYLDDMLVSSRDAAEFPEVDALHYMLLSMQVGSNLQGWVPRPDGTTPDIMDLLIKSVRVYQKPGPKGLRLSATSYLDNLAVGGVVAAITTENTGLSGGNVVTEVADPDAMFAVSGSNLVLSQVVPATTKDNHDLTLKTTDTLGRTQQKKFNIKVITGTPAQANLITQQSFADASWTKEALTAPNATTVLETTADAQHNLYRGGITRAAGVKTFNAWVEAVASLGRSWLHLSIYDSSFGSQATAWFNLDAGTIGFSIANGAWSNCVPFIAVLGGGKLRCGFKFTTDTATTGFGVKINLALAEGSEKYAGETARGMLLSNPWLYNIAAGPGSS